MGIHIVSKTLLKVLGLTSIILQDHVKDNDYSNDEYHYCVVQNNSERPVDALAEKHE